MRGRDGKSEVGAWLGAVKHLSHVFNTPTLSFITPPRVLVECVGCVSHPFSNFMPHCGAHFSAVGHDTAMKPLRSAFKRSCCCTFLGAAQCLSRGSSYFWLRYAGFSQVVLVALAAVWHHPHRTTLLWCSQSGMHACMCVCMCACMHVSTTHLLRHSVYVCMHWPPEERLENCTFRVTPPAAAAAAAAGGGDSIVRVSQCSAERAFACPGFNRCVCCSMASLRP
mgnify:CR=1 FL=1